MANFMHHESGRRTFLKRLAATGAATIVGTSANLLGRPMRAWAMPGDDADTVVVNVFLRGGADGLNIVVPHGDADYYAIRPTLGIQASEYIDLDGFFGLNNQFQSLYSHFSEGRLAFVHAVGTPTSALTRSHFDAQPQMDTGMGATGWLQRSLQFGGAQSTAFDKTYSGITIGPRVSPPLQGPWFGSVVETIGQTASFGMSLQTVRPTLEAMYDTASDRPDKTLEETIVATSLLSIDQLGMVAQGDPGAYPSDALAVDFREAAALIKADIGVRGVAIDFGGWDTHANQTTRFAMMGPELAGALDAFQTDLGSAANRVVIVVMTEFGRTAHQNGSDGTDHGHGNFMMVMGEPLINGGGGQVHVAGSWPGLGTGQLHQERYLAVTSDFRTVLAEVIDRHLGVDPIPVFPSHNDAHLGLFGEASTTSSLLGDTDQSGAVDAADVELIVNDLVGNPTAGYMAAAGDLDGDGDTDLRDALLLAQQVVE